MTNHIPVIRGLTFCLFLSATFAAQGQGLPPRIASHPTNQIVAAGTEVRFSVGTAASATPLRFQWKKGSANITGATNSVLTFANVQVSAAGGYFVTVANSAGSVNSQIATLGVAGVRSQSVSLGANVAFVVNVSGPEVTGLQWQFNGADIPGATQAGYVVANARVADAGNYSVAVTHSTGFITVPATLEVDSTFTKITEGPMLTETSYASGATWGDYDNDGFIDLFLGQTTVDSNQGAATARNKFFRNSGDGTFSKITTGRIVTDSGNSAGTIWGDYDNDGFLDLFVTQYGGVNFLYHNNGDGSFTRVLTDQITKDSVSSFGAAWGDFGSSGITWLFFTG